jgi:hypothetical protein
MEPWYQAASTFYEQFVSVSPVSFAFTIPGSARAKELGHEWGYDEEVLNVKLFCRNVKSHLREDLQRVSAAHILTTLKTPIPLTC